MLRFRTTLHACTHVVFSGQCVISHDVSHYHKQLFEQKAEQLEQKLADAEQQCESLVLLFEQKAEQLEQKLADAERQCEKLEQQVKDMHNKVDELSGKNKSLEDEMSLYKVLLWQIPGYFCFLTFLVLLCVQCT